MIFARRLFSGGHTREFVVQAANEKGWEVRKAEDNRVVKRSWLHDWHQVENTMLRFGMEVTQLERDGWIELQRS